MLERRFCGTRLVGNLATFRIIPIPVLEIVLKIVVRFGNKQIVTESNQGLTI